MPKNSRTFITCSVILAVCSIFGVSLVGIAETSKVSEAATPAPSPSNEIDSWFGRSSNADDKKVGTNLDDIIALEKARNECPISSVTADDAKSSEPCAAVTVFCVPDEEFLPGANGFCMPSRCSISLPNSTCRLLGLKNLEVWSPSKLIKKLTKQTPRNISHARKICTARHELRHSQDPAGMSSCATERNAFDESIVCMRGYIEQYCSSSDGSSGWDRLDCEDARDSLCLYQSARDINDCLCRKLESNPSGGVENCIDCGKACVVPLNHCSNPDNPHSESNPDFGAAMSCAEIVESYCRQAGIPIPR